MDNKVETVAKQYVNIMIKVRSKDHVQSISPWKNFYYWDPIREHKTRTENLHSRRKQVCPLKPKLVIEVLNNR